ncbi:MAG: hypothetical protein Q7S40_21150 [Opitutaceae bacterium]|nr:hypothetical protein [Opitutaceae bacterium]
MRTSLALVSFFVVGISAVFAASTAPQTAPATRAPELTILGPNYPRAFFFRATEGQAANLATSYESWDADFSRLMGIIGKALDEEVLGREARNPEFFTRFKRAHPEQVVLLHFNGNARDPIYHTEKYFPGHWIHRQATMILADVPAQSGETTIKVRDASDFQVNTGRYKNANDDIALFGVTRDGHHDWNYCEQVQLVAVDRPAGTIRVRRGCYGTRPLAFKVGAARAAAHQAEGPWGRTNHLMWYYNFATHCPRDAEGKTAADRLADDLASWFGPGGKLAAFDGLEFDVMHHETRGDTDGDGEPDHGVIDAINRYGIGMIEFARQLRTRLGPARIIQGDGALGPGGRRSQRAFGILNGIESEGFPNLQDWAFDDWSGGLNRHAFWTANAHPPAFSYINHKWNQSVPGKPGEHQNPEVPFSRHRLSFAAAQFTDAAICYSFAPARDRAGQFGIWDELRGGTLQRPGWLGRPEGPALHVATTAPDLLAGTDWARRIGGPVTTRSTVAGVRIQPTDSTAARLGFTLRDLPTNGRDLVVQLTAQAETRAGYPREMARFLECELGGGVLNLIRGTPDQVGIGRRGKPETPLRPETGARLQPQPRTSIGGRTLPAYSIHPPYLDGKGYVFWTRDVDVPAAAELRFSIGMSDRAPGRSDGVWFKVLAAELTGGRVGPFTPLFERSTQAHAWMPCTVPLERFAGKRVRLKFVADCGPKDNATTDQGFWGDVKIVRAGLRDTDVTSPAHSMSWVNDRTFTSTFYFHDVRSPTVDLTFSLDGAESVTIAAVNGYARPDTMYRVFEHGLVLANPSRQSVTFDPATLTPGRQYQRLQGVPTQDPRTNNGEPVTGPITLGERDAVFLLRVK